MPIRAIAEAFGERVHWDKDKRVVVIGENYDTNKIKEEKTEVLDPLGLDYLYNKDMAGKSDEEKSNLWKKNEEMPPKVFKGNKNGEVEGLSCLVIFCKGWTIFWSWIK